MVLAVQNEVMAHAGGERAILSKEDVMDLAAECVWLYAVA